VKGCHFYQPFGIIYHYGVPLGVFVFHVGHMTSKPDTPLLLVCPRDALHLGITPIDKLVDNNELTQINE